MQDVLQREIHQQRNVEEGSFVVETSGLTKRFGDRTVVDHVDLRVPQGSAFGYLGPNGAGKTTLIRMLLGLTPATSGSMRLLGRPVPEGRAAALARVGAIVEEPRFLDYLTGRENLWVIAAAREPEAHHRIDGALARVGLAERAGERAAAYSQGMRQRLGVARCLLADPELLILDEPTNGLDPAGIMEFRTMVRTLVGEGRTVVLSSHLLWEVERICDAAAIVDRGRIVTQGPIADLAADGQERLLIRCGDQPKALNVLAGVSGTATASADGVHVTLAKGRDDPQAMAAEINRRLIEAGVAVFGLDLERASLEDRFMEITHRLEEKEVRG